MNWPKNPFDSSGEERGWMTYGECAKPEYPHDLMFPMTTDTVGLAIAKEACHVCPVRGECLRTALDHNETQGVWGGLGPDERASLKRLARRRTSAGVSYDTARDELVDKEIRY